MNQKYSSHAKNISKADPKLSANSIGKFEVYMSTKGNGKRLGLVIESSETAYSSVENNSITSLYTKCSPRHLDLQYSIPIIERNWNITSVIFFQTHSAITFDSLDYNTDS